MFTNDCCFRDFWTPSNTLTGHHKHTISGIQLFDGAQSTIFDVILRNDTIIFDGCFGVRFVTITIRTILIHIHVWATGHLHVAWWMHSERLIIWSKQDFFKKKTRIRHSWNYICFNLSPKRLPLNLWSLVKHIYFVHLQKHKNKEHSPVAAPELHPWHS